MNARIPWPARPKATAGDTRLSVAMAAVAAAWLAVGGAPIVDAGDARAAEVEIHFNDSPGEGFFDPTPFVPVGGNPATTLGQARRIAFEHAALLWARCLQSDVVIEIDAQLNPVPTTYSSGRRNCTKSRSAPGLVSPERIARAGGSGVRGR